MQHGRLAGRDVNTAVHLHAIRVVRWNNANTINTWMNEWINE